MPTHGFSLNSTAGDSQLYGTYSKDLKRQIEGKLQALQFELHPLEAHPLTHFFHVLWEGTGHWCMVHRVSRPEVQNAEFRLRRIPDTIVWESNIPKGWYRYEEERDGSTGAVLGNIKREKVDTQKVDSAFTAGKADTDIVATYISRGTYRGREVTKVLHLTTLTLRGFLFSRNRGKGSCIIQQFVEPQNGVYNDVIQAVWTQGLKCIVERRRNKQRLEDANAPLASRISTFDGPQHLSESVAVASKLASDVRVVCDSITEHFAANATSRGRKHVITRMIAQFKVDRKQRLVLLGLVGVRVAQRPCPRKELYLALDLAPEYVHVAEEEQEALFMGLEDEHLARTPSSRENRIECALAIPEPSMRSKPQRVKKLTAYPTKIKKQVSDARALQGGGRDAGDAGSAAKLLGDGVGESGEETPPARLWRLLRNAVVSRWYLARDSAAKLLSEMEDVCYRAVSQKLARTRAAFTFHISPFHKRFIHAATKFVEQLAVRECDTMMPDFWRDTTVFTIPDSEITCTPHHHYDVTVEAAREEVRRVFETITRHYEHPEDMGVRGAYRRSTTTGNIIFSRLAETIRQGRKMYGEEVASEAMTTPGVHFAQDAPEAGDAADADALGLDDVILTDDRDPEATSPHSDAAAGGNTGELTYSVSITVADTVSPSFVSPLVAPVRDGEQEAAVSDREYSEATGGTGIRAGARTADGRAATESTATYSEQSYSEGSPARSSSSVSDSYTQASTPKSGSVGEERPARSEARAPRASKVSATTAATAVARKNSGRKSAGESSASSSYTAAGGSSKMSEASTTPQAAAAPASTAIRNNDDAASTTTCSVSERAVGAADADTTSVASSSTLGITRAPQSQASHASSESLFGAGGVAKRTSLHRRSGSRSRKSRASDLTESMLAQGGLGSYHLGSKRRTSSRPGSRRSTVGYEPPPQQSYVERMANDDPPAAAATVIKSRPRTASKRRSTTSSMRSVKAKVNSIRRQAPRGSSAQPTAQATSGAAPASPVAPTLPSDTPPAQLLDAVSVPATVSAVSVQDGGAGDADDANHGLLPQTAAAAAGGDAASDESDGEVYRGRELASPVITSVDVDANIARRASASAVVPGPPEDSAPKAPSPEPEGGEGAVSPPSAPGTPRSAAPPTSPPLVSTIPPPEALVEDEEAAQSDHTGQAYSEREHHTTEPDTGDGTGDGSETDGRSESEATADGKGVGGGGDATSEESGTRADAGGGAGAAVFDRPDSRTREATAETLDERIMRTTQEALVDEGTRREEEAVESETRLERERRLADERDRHARAAVEQRVADVDAVKKEVGEGRTGRVDAAADDASDADKEAKQEVHEKVAAREAIRRESDLRMAYAMRMAQAAAAAAEEEEARRAEAHARVEARRAAERAAREKEERRGAEEAEAARVAEEEAEAQRRAAAEEEERRRAEAAAAEEAAAEAEAARRAKAEAEAEAARREAEAARIEEQRRAVEETQRKATAEAEAAKEAEAQAAAEAEEAVRRAKAEAEAEAARQEAEAARIEEEARRAAEADAEAEAAHIAAEQAAAEAAARVEEEQRRVEADRVAAAEAEAARIAEEEAEAQRRAEAEAAAAEEAAAEAEAARRAKAEAEAEAARREAEAEAARIEEQRRAAEETQRKATAEAEAAKEAEAQAAHGAEEEEPVTAQPTISIDAETESASVTQSAAGADTRAPTGRITPDASRVAPESSVKGSMYAGDTDSSGSGSYSDGEGEVEVTAPRSPVAAMLPASPIPRAASPTEDAVAAEPDGDAHNDTGPLRDIHAALSSTAAAAAATGSPLDDTHNRTALSSADRDVMMVSALSQGAMDADAGNAAPDRGA